VSKQWLHLLQREKEEGNQSVFNVSMCCPSHQIFEAKTSGICFAVSLPTGMLNRYTAHRPTSPKDKDCYQNVSGREIENDPK